MDRWGHTASGSSPFASGKGVQVIARTWARDSHDLFDFEASQIQSQTFSVPNSTKFVRRGSDVETLHDSDIPPAEVEPMIRLIERHGAFWVDKPSQAVSNTKKLWVVVRDLANGRHMLSEGDVIKLGRAKLRIRQMVASESSVAQPDIFLDDKSECHLQADHEEKLSSATCRICLLEGSSDEDPLISPCQCRGSIEHVHLGCLRHWVKGRQNLDESPQGSYFYRPLPCELCKTSYPSSIVKSGGEVMRLVELPKLAPPFVVLESTMRDHRTPGRGIHVVSLADQKLLKFGRGHESNVRIQDVSISRCHATIRFHEGQFILEDNNSKFGTLVAMKKPWALDGDTQLSIQVGRTVLSLTLQSGTTSPTAAVDCEDQPSAPQPL